MPEPARPTDTPADPDTPAITDQDTPAVSDTNTPAGNGTDASEGADPDTPEVPVTPDVKAAFAAALERKKQAGQSRSAHLDGHGGVNGSTVSHKATRTFRRKSG